MSSIMGRMETFKYIHIKCYRTFCGFIREPVNTLVYIFVTVPEEKVLIKSSALR